MLHELMGKLMVLLLYALAYFFRFQRIKGPAQCRLFLRGQELIRYISKVSNPYMMSELSRELAAAALSDRTYADSHGPDFAAMKRSLRGVCGKELTMAETDDRVPICLLQHRNPRADLQELLMAEGVLTCSGGEFEPLDRSSVRLRVPRAEELDKLLRAVEKVNNG